MGTPLSYEDGKRLAPHDRRRLQQRWNEDEFGGKSQTRPLTNEQRRWAEEYFVHADPKLAAKNAGYESPERGYELLRNKTVVNYLTMLRQRQANRLEISADYVLRRWLAIEAADARELSGIHHAACRHCWGIEHHYQFVDMAEMHEAVAKHNSEQALLPEELHTELDTTGDIGYSALRDPMRGSDWVVRELSAAAGIRRHYAMLGMDGPLEPEANSDHTCPRCWGDGEPRPYVADTRHLSPQAALLYDGYKIDRRGNIEVKGRSRDHALDMIANHLGMTVQRNVNINVETTLAQAPREALLQLVNKFVENGTITDAIVREMFPDKVIENG